MDVTFNGQLPARPAIALYRYPLSGRFRRVTLASVASRIASGIDHIPTWGGGRLGLWGLASREGHTWRVGTVCRCDGTTRLLSYDDGRVLVTIRENPKGA